MNWVERRAIREANLKAGTPDLWQDVIATIDTSCKTLTTHYGPGLLAESRTTNGHHLVVNIAVKNGDIFERRIVALEFHDGEKPHISVTVDSDMTQTFNIDADQESSYIVSGALGRVSLDDFAKLILEKPMFSKPKVTG